MKDTKSTVEISKPLNHPELDSKCLLTIFSAYLFWNWKSIADISDI